jgi:DNA-directed RNA polymerase subunit RPC12/RpoP
MLFIEDNQLSDSDSQIFRCPKCAIKLKVRPNLAQCGKCSEIFKYFKYKLDASGLVRCTNCKTVNRIKNDKGHLS